MEIPSKQDLSLLEELRSAYKEMNEELIRENNLIHDRMNMFLTAQAFLLAAMGLTVEKDLSAESIIIIKTVIFVGIASSLLTLVSISTAIYVFFRYFMEIKREILPSLRKHDPYLRVLERKRWEVWLGFSATLGIPLILLVAWIFLALVPGFNA